MTAETIARSNSALYNQLLKYIESTAPKVAKELASTQGLTKITPELTNKVMVILSKLPNIKSLNLNPEQKQQLVQRLWAKLGGAEFGRAIGRALSKL